MSALRVLLIILFFVGFSLLFCHCYSTSVHDNIVAVDDYPHAVYICGDGITINEGHEDDIEVKILLAKAVVYCPEGK